MANVAPSRRHREATGGTDTRALRDRIAASISRLTPSESAVAQFLLEHDVEVPFMSAAEIATRTRLGTATVIRATQALGYAGLPELKRELRELARTRGTGHPRVEHDLDDLGPDPEQSLEHTLSYQISRLSRMRETIEPGEFRRGVEILAAAQRIGVVGFGLFPEHAHYFAKMVRRFGRRSLEIVGRGDAMADDLMELSAGDALVVIAYGRLSREIAVLLDLLEERHVPAVVVGDALTMALRGPTVVALTAERGGIHPFETGVAPFAVLEALLFAILGQDRTALSSATDRRLDLSRKLARSRDEVPRAE